MLLMISLADELIVVETPVLQLETISGVKILTSSELMESNSKIEKSRRNNSTSASEAGIEPGVEFLKGAGLPLVQHLPSLHNAVSATPIFSSYRSVLQGWKNSVPKLYKYPSSEIEVVIYRKNGQIDKLQRTSRNEEKQQNKSGSDSDASDNTFMDSPKNISHLLDEASSLQMIKPTTSSKMMIAHEETSNKPFTSFEFSDTTTVGLSQLYSNKNQDVVIPSTSSTRFANVPEHLIEFQALESHWSSYTSALPNQTSTLNVSKVGSDLLVSIPNKSILKENIQYLNHQSQIPDESDANEKTNCQFTFGYRLSPVRFQGTNFENRQCGVENSYNLFEKVGGCDNEAATTVFDASCKMTDSFTQTEVSFLSTSTNESAVQHSPENKSAYIQTSGETKDTHAVGCQYTQAIFESKPTQTNSPAIKSFRDISSQIISSVNDKENQTEPLNLRHVDCQVQVLQTSEETQTSCLVGVHAECQVEEFRPTTSSETQTDMQSMAIKSTGCQAVISTESKFSQVEPSDKVDLATQFSPICESKEIQLSGSCCYFREMRVRKEFERRIKQNLKQIRKDEESDVSVGPMSLPLQFLGDPLGDSRSEVSSPSGTSLVRSETSVSLGSTACKYTDDDVHKLIQKFNNRVKQTQEYHNELHQKVSQLKQQIVAKNEETPELNNHLNYYSSMHDPGA